MSLYDQFLSNAVKNALASVQKAQAASRPPVEFSVAQAVGRAAAQAIPRAAVPAVSAPAPMSTPSPLSAMGMANTGSFGRLPDPVDLGRQTAIHQLIQRNTIPTVMGQLQQRLSQPAATPSPLSVLGMANTSSRPVALPSSQDARRGALFGTSPVLGVQKAAQAAVSEGAENRPGSSTAASTGQRVGQTYARSGPTSPIELVTVFETATGRHVVLPKDQVSTLPPGWQMGDPVPPENAARAKQSDTYIDNQDDETKALFSNLRPTEGAEGRPSSSTSASTGQRLALFGEGAENRPGYSTAAGRDTWEPIVVFTTGEVGTNGEHTVYVPESRAQTTPPGWTQVTTFDTPKEAAGARQREEYIDKQRAEIQALFPQEQPTGPTSPTRTVPVTSGSAEPDRTGLSHDIYREGESKRPAQPKKTTEDVVVVSTTNPSAPPIAMSEWTYWTYYRNDPTYQVVTGNPLNGGILNDPRMTYASANAIRGQQQKGIVPSADLGDPNATTHTFNGGWFGNAIHGAMDVLDWARQKNVSTASGAALKQARGEELSPWEWASLWWIDSATRRKGYTSPEDVITVRGPDGRQQEVTRAEAAALPSGYTIVFDVQEPGYQGQSTSVLNREDMTFSVYVKNHQTEAEWIYEHGYGSNEDGTIKYTGDQAVWEWYVSHLTPWERAGVDFLSDPLTYAGEGVGRVGKGVSAAGKVMRADKGSTIIGKAIGTGGEIVGEVIQQANDLLGMIPPGTDKVVDWLLEDNRSSSGAGTNKSKTKQQPTVVITNPGASEPVPLVPNVKRTEAGPLRTSPPPTPEAAPTAKPQATSTSTVTTKIPVATPPVTPSASPTPEPTNPSISPTPYLVPTPESSTSTPGVSWGTPVVTTLPNGTTAAVFSNGTTLYTTVDGRIWLQYPDGRVVQLLGQ